MRQNKLVVMGAGGVGKTSLVVGLLGGAFNQTYRPTVEDYYRHTLQLPNGLFHTVEILDTAGSHHFPAMRELSIRSSRAFVLVFSVDNEQSFYEVMAIWDLIVKIKGNADVPVILVGNKVDLEERMIPVDVPAEYAQSSMNNCRYLETSAKYNLNVNQLFSELVMKTFYGDEVANVGIDKGESRISRRLSRRLSSLSLRRKSNSTCLAVVGDPLKGGHSVPPLNEFRCIIL